MDQRLSKILIFFAVSFLSALSTQAQIVPFGFFRAPPPDPGPPTCPSGYVMVPKLTGYTSVDFCVAKYEARKSGAMGVSIPTGTPWVSITRSDAAAACSANGGKYSLITNNHWQTIARNIELKPENWSNGTVGSGWLNFGNTEKGAVLSASTNDDDACFGTGATCSKTVFYKYRRIHKLSNGNWIWDFAGNVDEFISNTPTPTPTAHFVALLAPGVDKDIYGSSGNYASLPGFDQNPYGCFGATLQGIVGSVVRGGNHSSGVNGGIFAAQGAGSSTATSASRGFRCIYTP